MVILPYNIPYGFAIGSGAVLLILIAAIVFIIHKRRRNRKKSADISVHNANFNPPLPISNIIKDKIRKPDARNAENTENKNKVILRLTELPSGTVHCIKMKKTITLGRKINCSVRIKDTYAAPVHCFISFYDGQAYIEDNNTLNGTILNGILIKNRVPIYTNDLILIGNTEYKAEVLA